MQLISRSVAVRPIPTSSSFSSVIRVQHTPSTLAKIDTDPGQDLVRCERRIEPESPARRHGTERSSLTNSGYRMCLNCGLAPIGPHEEGCPYCGSQVDLAPNVEPHRPKGNSHAYSKHKNCLHCGEGLISPLMDNCPNCDHTM